MRSRCCARLAWPQVIGDTNVLKQDKKGVLDFMRAAKLELKVIFTLDPEGYQALPPSIRNPVKKAEPKAKVEKEWNVELLKGDGGYGLVLAADTDTPGSGIFVRSVKPGSVAESVLKVGGSGLSHNLFHR